MTIAHVHVHEYDETDGLVRLEYDAGIRRAGRVWNIVSVQGQLPEVMRDSLRLYVSMMFGPSPLTRWQREMVAVVTSRANDCRYCTTAHLYDLRDELGNQDLVDRFADNWRTAGLDSPTLALLEHAEKRTRAPTSISADDIERLRQEGFDDRGISSVTQVVAYFNYINRVAEGLGVPLEAWLRADRRLHAV